MNSSRKKSAEFLIIGAGIVGLTIARELFARFSDARIVVLEKEADLGRHGSGRNSGVLHSGIYYPAHTLKAKVCRRGAQELAEFHDAHGLPLRRCGKVLIPTSEEDLEQINLLDQRGRENGVPAHIIDGEQLAELEPEANREYDRALYVESTAVGTPTGVLEALQKELGDSGIEIRTGTAVQTIDTAQRTLRTQAGEDLSYGHLVNAAGLFADRLAHQCGVGEHYSILPFKGLYWKLDPVSGIRPQRLIYPLPDLRVPFLGIHTTTTVEEVTYLGPTAIPAFGRENYRGLDGFRWQEARSIASAVTGQLFANRDGFRRLAVREAAHYLKPAFARAARGVLRRLETRHLQPCEKVGIRPQLQDRRTGKLVNDFVVEAGEHSTHILNAISPAWTGSFPFARMVAEEWIAPALSPNSAPS